MTTTFQRTPRWKPDLNKVWTQTELIEGEKLAALLNAGADDAALTKAKYGQDSRGNWFLDGALIPTPIPSKQPGVGVLPFSPAAAAANR